MCRDPGNAVLNRQPVGRQNGVETLFIVRQKGKHTAVEEGCKTTCVYRLSRNNTNNFTLGSNID